MLSQLESYGKAGDKIFRPINIGDFSNSYKGGLKSYVATDGDRRPDFVLDYKMLSKNQEYYRDKLVRLKAEKDAKDFEN